MLYLQERLEQEAHQAELNKVAEEAAKKEQEAQEAERQQDAELEKQVTQVQVIIYMYAYIYMVFALWNSSATTINTPVNKITLKFHETMQGFCNKYVDGTERSNFQHFFFKFAVISKIVL